jgi:hypothetical protein
MWFYFKWKMIFYTNIQLRPFDYRPDSNKNKKNQADITNMMPGRFALIGSFQGKKHDFGPSSRS